MNRQCKVLDDYIIHRFSDSKEIKELKRHLDSFLSVVKYKAGLTDDYTMWDIDHIRDTLFCEVWFVVH